MSKRSYCSYSERETRNTRSTLFLRACSYCSYCSYSLLEGIERSREGSVHKRAGDLKGTRRNDPERRNTRNTLLCERSPLPGISRFAGLATSAWLAPAVLQLTAADSALARLENSARRTPVRTRWPAGWPGDVAGKRQKPAQSRLRAMDVVSTRHHSSLPALVSA